MFICGFFAFIHSVPAALLVSCSLENSGLKLSLSLMNSPSPSTICWFEHLQAVYMSFRSFTYCYCTVKCSSSILMNGDSCPTLNTCWPVLSSPFVGCYTQYLQPVVSHTYQTGLVGEFLQWNNWTMDLVQAEVKVTYQCFCQISCFYRCC